MELLCFPLQSHPRGIGFNTAMASAGTVRPIQRHHKVAKLCSTEGAAVDQLMLVDDSSTDPCRETDHCGTAENRQPGCANAPICLAKLPSVRFKMSTSLDG